MADNPNKYLTTGQIFLLLIWKSLLVLLCFVLFALYAFFVPDAPQAILIVGWSVLIPLSAFYLYRTMRLYSAWKTSNLLENIGDRQADVGKKTEDLLTEARQHPESPFEIADALYARSLFLFTRAEFQESLKAAQERVEILRDSHDVSRLALALTWLAEVCGRTGDMESAQRHAALAVQLLQPSSANNAADTTSYVGALRTQGTIFYQLHKFKDAGSLFQQSLDLMKSIEAPEQVLMPYITMLGATFAQLGQFDSAEKMLGEALNIAEKHESKDSKLLASVYTRLGRLYARTDRLDLAQKYSDQAIAILEAIPEGERGGDGAYYCDAGLVCLKQGRLPKAEEYLLKAMQSVKEKCSEQHPGLVRIQEILQEVYQAQNRPAEAEKIGQEKDAVINLHKMG